MKPHLSEEQISEWIAGERNEEAGSHLRDCPGCTAEVAYTEKALLLFRDSGYRHAEYWRNQPSAQPARRLGRWAAAGVAVAASAMLLVVAIRHHPSARPAQPRQELFLQIPYVIPPAPYERTEVVRMDVPVAALIAAGFRMEAPAADSVSADVLVGQDGRPLAVGFPENIQ